VLIVDTEVKKVQQAKDCTELEVTELCFLVEALCDMPTYRQDFECRFAVKGRNFVTYVPPAQRESP